MPKLLPTSKRGFIAELFHQNYSSTWEPEREYRVTPRDFASAITDLRNRTGLTQAQFIAIAPGNILAGSNIRNLEINGSPMRPEVCTVLAHVAADYGLPGLANYFNACVRHIKHIRRKGRRYNMDYEEGMTWLHEKL